jgi:21S rRNA (GM2251-2'-O)-methyltransferase
MAKSSSSSFAPRTGRRGSNASSSSSSSFSQQDSNNSYNNKDSRSSRYGNHRGSSYGGGDRAGRPSRFGGTRGPSFADRADRGDDALKKINLKALDGAGYDHLYGLAPVRNALQAQRREFVPLENRLLADESDHVGNDEDPTRRPEAQFRPYLFVQERQQRGGRVGDKALQASQVERLAEERGVPIAYVDKGVLNTLSGNRPHQGYVLRCGKLSWEPITRLPLVDKEVIDTDDESSNSDSIWLVLDQIVDPQNLGALLRSAYFLGPVRVLVCAKNSAPPSAVVSASSAGALEEMAVYATQNLPRTLAAAEQDGFRIIGAAAESPEKGNALGEVPVYELPDMPRRTSDQPTLLVLGSEGHGLRPLVASTCTEFVKIPGGAAGNVDSLNVSVTGGILLWELTPPKLL